VSATGQVCAVDRVGSTAVLVATFAMPTASRYTRHTHDVHQLAWASRGVLIVATDAGTWVLPPARALWIPAGIAHETIASATTTMRSLYLSAHMCPITWSQPQPVEANALFAELLGYLARSGLNSERRERAEAVLLDLLEPVAVTTVHAPIPDDECAARAARALLDNPADPRSLEEWGQQVSRKRAHPGPRVPQPDGSRVRPLADASPHPGRPAGTRRRRARQPRRSARRLPDNQRVRCRVPARDQHHSRRVLPSQADLTALTVLTRCGAVHAGRGRSGLWP
jgi:quercetin dioxygenase-like cupin family protein